MATIKSPYKKFGVKVIERRIRTVKIRVPSVKESLRPLEIETIKMFKGSLCSNGCPLSPCSNNVYFRCRGVRRHK